ncbi:uracil-DNA glycosylase family protein [Paenibacillus naphthalenovorans]|uniref:uracil-DNA glycosylase family protein n=1 Tax=Paenibacillus naphthalenovorans TaxID=162209 RepID=UPI00088765A2|nr:uracil-DNA glycosylase family protein [Paenibacillus naphthalenovorans]SDI36654.1 DNA polymerase [Paenibacillus naphthalenovorans]
MSNTNKQIAYKALVNQRKKCTICDPAQCELINPGLVQDKSLDTNKIGHWTEWQGSLDAKIMVVGQDWGDFNTLVGQKGKSNVEESATNRALVQLLNIAGVDIDERTARNRHEDLFFTNAILCMKTKGGLAGKVRGSWFRNCVSTFLKPLIEDIIQPKVVITLGEKATRSLLREYGYKGIKFRELVERDSPIKVSGNTVVFPVFHCGSLGRRNRPFEQQKLDWLRIKRYLESPYDDRMSI